MTIKFLDLYKQTFTIKKDIINSITKNIINSDFVNGKDLRKFEKSFSQYLKIKYCLGVANGTDALEIAIKCLNLKKKSEIIVPANTWISGAEAVLNNNFKLKFVDTDNTHNICINDLKKKINKNTSAVIAVHLYGNPANILEIKKICKLYSLKLIEDCAQAHGARFLGKNISTFGDISTFSFFPSKNLGGYGDGGAIVTNNKKYFLICKKLANHGGLKKNIHQIVGRNSRLDNINAGVLNIKLKYLNKWITIRKSQVKLYKKYLANVGDIKFIEKYKNAQPSHYLFVIKSRYRNKLKKILKKRGIETLIHYPLTLPETPAFKKKYFSECKKMNIINNNKKILSLPVGEHLNLKDIKKICNRIKDIYKKNLIRN
jgi:dTDP-4-amino-4,6-dideoxygalactose transaminase